MSRPVAAADRWAPVVAATATLLTLWSMSPVVDGRGWWNPSLLMLLIVVGVGYGARAVRLPIAAVAPAQLLVGLIGLTAVFAGGEAVLGLLPGPDAVTALARVVADGGDTIHRYQAPVPIGDGISLLIAAGVLGVAVVVELVAVTLRAPAAAGLPLLALYCVPAAVVPDGLSARYFVAAALGWLLLLAHDASARVLRWGRLLPRWGGASSGTRVSVASDTGALAATGRRLGVAAVAVAVLVPALAPGLSEGLLTTGGGSGDGRAGITVINPVLTLRDNLNPRRDVEVLRYTTAAKTVAPLRLLTADSFDGNEWRPATTEVSRRQRASRGMPAPPGLSANVARQAYSMRIEVGGTLDQDFLPLPYPASRVDIEGAWLYDASSLNVFGEGETVRNKSYGVDYLDVAPTAEQLRAAPEPPDAIRTTYTRLPRSLPDVVRTTAADLTKDVVSKYDKALVLQQWFREDGGFTYSTRAPSDAGGDAVAAFLDQKRGFCVQFSSAMAVMARALGIPARIAVGFLPGSKDGADTYSVKLTAAHAWPELYFEGAGWVRFEPTPASRTGVAPAWAQPAIVPPPPSGGPSAGRTTSATASSSVPARRRLGDPVTPAPGSTTRPQAGATEVAVQRSVPWRYVVMALVLLLALALTPVTAVLARGRRRRAAHDDRARIEAAWADLHEGAADLGVPLSPGSTPRQLDAELALAAHLASGDRQALGRVALSVERSRYSRTGVSADGVDADVRVVLKAVAGTRSRGQRALALALPRSGTARLARLGDRAGQRVGLVDQRVSRGLRGLPRRRVRRRR